MKVNKIKENIKTYKMSECYCVLRDMVIDGDACKVAHEDCDNCICGKITRDTVEVNKYV